MRQTISKTRYILAFVLTTLIFCFGLLLGLTFQYQRATDLSTALDEQRAEYNSIILQYQYVSELEEEHNCEFLSNVFNKNLEDLNTDLQRLQVYSQQKKINAEDYHHL